MIIIQCVEESLHARNLEIQVKAINYMAGKQTSWFGAHVGLVWTPLHYVIVGHSVMCHTYPIHATTEPTFLALEPFLLPPPQILQFLHYYHFTAVFPSTVIAQVKC